MRKVLSFALIALGLLQTVGWIAGSRALRGVGAALSASPLPLVFSDTAGLEPFASGFSFSYRSPGRRESRVPVTPALYARLGGPYNRRNAYGAAIAYGPRLPEAVWRPVLVHAFCKGGSLARRFELPDDIATLTVHIETRTRGRADRWDLVVSCDR